MSLQRVKHVSGRTLVLGRRAPKPGHHPGLMLRKYLLALKIALPASVSYAPLASSALAEMYLNDSLGDCVIAGGYHLLGIATGNADGGTPFLATPDQITADYEAIGGYVPGNPDTDQGCDQPTAFAYWMGLQVNGVQGKGFADGSTLAGYANVDATNAPEVQTAIVAFESVTFGVCLPAAWVAGMGSLQPGAVWDVAGPPVPENGHDFIACGYNAQGVQICTWGMIITITWAAVAMYATESAGGALYALLSNEQVGKGQMTAPNGLDWPTLLADLATLPGEIVNGNAPPIPPPAPAPPPAPPAPPAPPFIPPPAGALAAALAQIDADLASDSATLLATAATARAAAIQAWADAQGTPSASTPSSSTKTSPTSPSGGLSTSSATPSATSSTPSAPSAKTAPFLATNPAPTSQVVTSSATPRGGPAFDPTRPPMPPLTPGAPTIPNPTPIAHGPTPAPQGQPRA